MGGDRLLLRGSSRESHDLLLEGTLPSSLASDMRVSLLRVCLLLFLGIRSEQAG